LRERGSGILMHITSLPSPYGIGDLGPEAYNFVDFLSETHQHYWQILPLNLTHSVYGHSPYSSFSSCAGNPLLISPDRMIKDGFLSEKDLGKCPEFSADRVDYGTVTIYKTDLLRIAFEKIKSGLAEHQDFQKFCTSNSDWLDDYSLFISIKHELKGIDWGRWPDELKLRKISSLKTWTKKLSNMILREKFLQYIFFNQWHSLKNYCDSKGIRLIGDIPIYVNYDSVDVWAHPEIFSLDKDNKPMNVAGVPPDYFSSTGQLWGHPVYNWDVLRDSKYEWWLKRIEQNLMLFHLFRLDHFRGFVGYWQVKSTEETAINGKWVQAPAKDFFKTVIRKLPDIQIIAEDLGVITPDVKEIMEHFGFPGMKVLLFAFGDDLPTNPYAPHNHVYNCVVYTGTHDNNTIRGWFKKELDQQGKNRVSAYIGHDVQEKNIHWDIIRLAMMSVAAIVIIPMQDILGLGEKDRMNLPASLQGNWRWRLKQEQLTQTLKKKLVEITETYGRKQPAG
jgi:4-alpha-glucanotransferase